jgi:hypothetical protein
LWEFLPRCRDDDGKIKVSGVPILSIQAFLYNGRQVDFIWEDAGISLHIPQSLYKGEIEISVAIFRTSDECFTWSEGYRFMPPASASYKITASDTLPVPVRVRMQHCAIVEEEDSLVYLVYSTRWSSFHVPTISWRKVST